MGKRQQPEWGVRLRRHIKASRKRMGDVAEAMGIAESSLRSWLNGTRKINVEEFEQLCAVADADVATILVGRPALSDKQWAALRVVTGQQ